MRKRFQLLAASLVVSTFALVVGVSELHAGDLNYPGGAYWGGCNYRLNQIQRIPYFAQYPPVYYSRPVPRTYGYSPFAYPPGVMTPELRTIKPLEMRNPYVEETNVRTTSTKATSSPVAATMINPYFADGKKVAGKSQLALIDVK